MYAKNCEESSIRSVLLQLDNAKAAVSGKRKL